jgi:hypothetical protein
MRHSMRQWKNRGPGFFLIGGNHGASLEDRHRRHHPRVGRELSEVFEHMAMERPG